MVPFDSKVLMYRQNNLISTEMKNEIKIEVLTMIYLKETNIFMVS